jgi:tetratricopeptide (TPR) repeat protein
VHESRGVAKALIGDFAGAIADFQFFVNAMEQDDQEKERLRERQRWIQSLHAGHSPFDTDTLQGLRLKASGVIDAAQELIAQGHRFLKQGKLGEAIAAVTEAQRLYPRLELSLYAGDFITVISELSLSDNIDHLRISFKSTEFMSKIISDEKYRSILFYSICLNGIVLGYASEFIEACEKSIAFDPTRIFFRYNRALARALSGNLQGSLEDFDFIVHQLEQFPVAKSVLLEIEQWRSALRLGRNRIDKTTLQGLTEVRLRERRTKIGSYFSKNVSLIDLGAAFARAGNIQDALMTFAEAQRLDPTQPISAEAWDTLCWFGSMWNAARDVMLSCDQAVALAPDHGLVRTSRGIAKALQGDYAQAITDLQYFVTWFQESPFIQERFRKAGNKLTGETSVKYNIETLLKEHKAWIKTLRQGQNPFTSSVLEKLRTSYPSPYPFQPYYFPSIYSLYRTYWEVSRSQASETPVLVGEPIADQQPAPTLEQKDDTESSPDRKDISLTFLSVDLKEVIDSIGKLTGKNFVVDDKVRGKIDLISPEPLTMEEVYEQFLSILEIQGFQAISQGPVVRIVPLRQVK